ncbi:ABC transporter ATP-binding protein [Pseudoduganella namucuonensis]|uniref:Putative ABC transport system ATP-binding protein n=1 Tax=Pseudoduganella namucuonensis TaxID=1035707 RepID=A0A1I7GXL0_9BURK|nr:ABC transporter ATP-binding protein [Pseudoduganella namucuonensis]SFU53152.1 putative ABC transport system ATP-binding protein [Pseudoduganella namucuonensis]
MLNQIQPPLLELRGVGKQYQLGEVALDALAGVDLRIERGEFIAVWGPSGSGKSTLCNLLGLLDTPTSGSLAFDGEPTARMSDRRRSDVRNRAIGFVFQSFNLVPVLSALENVMLPLQIGGAPERTARAEAAERLAQVGLAAHMAHRPARLSGGQQQRVAIARALITRPALVVADEPTANLDTENAVMIIELMRRIGRHEGATFVFSTHDERLLGRVDRQLQLRDGRAVSDRQVAPARGVS